MKTRIYEVGKYYINILDSNKGVCNYNVLFSFPFTSYSKAEDFAKERNCRNQFCEMVYVDGLGNEVGKIYEPKKAC